MGLLLENGLPSLSSFQILLWTLVTVWALVFVFFETGSLLTMTPEFMILLGFAGTGSLVAKKISRDTPPPPPTEETKKKEATEETKKPPWFLSIVEHNGQLDLFKLQLFLFTLLIAVYAIVWILRRSAFPPLEADFLLLMGISNGLYVGKKELNKKEAVKEAEEAKRKEAEKKAEEAKRALGESRSTSLPTYGGLMTQSQGIFETKALRAAADYLAPDGSEIRLLPTMKGGGLCHCTLPAGKTSSPVAHRQVEEIWFVISGDGEVWRKNAATEETVRVCRVEPDDPAPHHVPVPQHR